MTQKKRRQAQAAEGEQTMVVAQVKETAFARESLRAHSKALFGVEPEIFDGALYGVSATEPTKQEVRQMINQFLIKEATR